MARRAEGIVVSQEERAELERIARARTSAQQHAQRARIVVRAAEGAENQVIAAELGLARYTVGQWRRRFAAALWGGAAGGHRGAGLSVSG